MIAATATVGRLWRNPTFLLLISGQTISQCGSAVTILALPLIAVAILKVSTLQVGILISAGTVAFLIAALPVGVIVDRSRKRRIMIWCDVLRFLVIGTVPVAAIIGSITVVQLYSVAFTAGLLTVFFQIAYQAYPPALFSTEQLVDCNTMLGTSGSIAQVAGPTLGAILVSAIGAARTLTTDALSFLVSAITLVFIRESGPEAASSGAAASGVPEKKPSYRIQIAEGLSFLLRHPVLSRITASTAIMNLLNTMATSVEMIYLVRVLHVGIAYTGVLVSIAEIGGIIFGLMASSLSRRIGTARIIWVAPLVLSILGVLIPLAQPGVLSVLYSVGWWGFSGSAILFNISSQTYRQIVCPRELLGRVGASGRWIVYGVMPFGGILGGVLGTALGVRSTLWIVVICSWLTSLLLVSSPLRKMRDIPAPVPVTQS